MGALARERLSTRTGSSVFYHVLEAEGQSPEEEVQDRNFRDLVYVMVPAWVYVHVLFFSGMCQVSHPLRFLTVNHMFYLPEVNEHIEERMLGVYPLHFYVTPNIDAFTNQELYYGEHLVLGEGYLASLYLTPDEFFFYSFWKSFQNN